MAFALGDPVRIEMEKWGDLPHWQIPGHWLGSDEHGDWIGIPRGTPMSWPGMHVVSQNDQVGLVPPADVPETERWWVSTFHGPGGSLPVAVYVDIATPPVWDGSTLRTVDLDLDVVRNDTGGVWSTTRTSSPSTASSSATPTGSPPEPNGPAPWCEPGWRPAERRTTAPPALAVPAHLTLTRPSRRHQPPTPGPWSPARRVVR